MQTKIRYPTADLQKPTKQKGNKKKKPSTGVQPNPKSQTKNLPEFHSSLFSLFFCFPTCSQTRGNVQWATRHDLGNNLGTSKRNSKMKKKAGHERIRT